MNRFTAHRWSEQDRALVSCWLFGECLRQTQDVGEALLAADVAFAEASDDDFRRILDRVHRDKAGNQDANGANLDDGHNGAALSIGSRGDWSEAFEILDGAIAKLKQERAA